MDLCPEKWRRSQGRYRTLQSQFVSTESLHRAFADFRPEQTNQLQCSTLFLYEDKTFSIVCLGNLDVWLFLESHAPSVSPQRYEFICMEISKSHTPKVLSRKILSAQLHDRNILKFLTFSPALNRKEPHERKERGDNDGWNETKFKWISLSLWLNFFYIQMRGEIIQLFFFFSGFQFVRLLLRDNLIIFPLWPRCEVSISIWLFVVLVLRYLAVLSALSDSYFPFP